jgi:hypothetical protein
LFSLLYDRATATERHRTTVIPLLDIEMSPYLSSELSMKKTSTGCTCEVETAGAKALIGVEFLIVEPILNAGAEASHEAQRRVNTAAK